MNKDEGEKLHDTTIHVDENRKRIIGKQVDEEMEQALEQYDKGEITTERLAEELGVNYFVLHGALRRGSQLFQQVDEAMTDRELEEKVAMEAQKIIDKAYEDGCHHLDSWSVAYDITKQIIPVVKASIRQAIEGIENQHDYDPKSIAKVYWDKAIQAVLKVLE